MQPMTQSCQRPAPVGGRHWMRLAVMGLVLLGSALGLMAQSYQSQFDSIAFDKAKGPMNDYGVVQVDPATGALNFKIPLGPGIGARGATYQPVITGNWAPNINLEKRTIGAAYSSSYLWMTRLFGVGIARDGVYGDMVEVGTSLVFQKPGNFSLSPGYLELPFPGPAAPIPTVVLPGGVTSTFGYGTTPTNLLLGSLDPVKVLKGFEGYGSGWRVVPTLDGEGAQIGANGNLILALASDQEPPYSMAAIVPIGHDFSEAWNWTYTGYPFDRTYPVPRRFVVVAGDTAYEFKLAVTRYVKTYVEPPEFNDPYRNDLLNSRSLSAARYRLTRILNRFGEWVEFQYQTLPPPVSTKILRRENYYPFTATWHSPLQSDSPAIQIGAGQITYTGVASAPNFVLTSPGAGSIPCGGGWQENYPVNYRNGPGTPLPSSFWDQVDIGDWDRWHEMYLSGVTNQTTGQGISLTYALGPVVSNGILGQGSPTVIQSVQFPGKTLSFQWSVYPYRKNLRAEGGGFMGSEGLDYITTRYAGGSTYYDQPAFDRTLGISRIDEISGSETRTTTHTRITPVPKALTKSDWDATTFSDVIRHPDGQVTAIRYVEPLPSGTGGPAIGATPGASPADQMRTLAHLKHQVQEMRHYAANTFTASDFSGLASASAAYKIEFHDRWDTHAHWNTSGSLTSNPVPSSTRARVWDQDQSSLSTSASWNWDMTNGGWTQMGQAVNQASLAPNASVDYLSLDMPPVRSESFGAGSVVNRQKVITLDSIPSTWTFGRVRKEVGTQFADLPGSMATGATFPWVLPTKTTSYVSGTNQVESVTTGDPAGLYSRVTFGYSGPRLINATVTGGPTMALSGQIGIATYGYDSATGFLNSIRPIGAAWTLGQDSDLLGRPIKQIDANQIPTQYGWDGAGRLASISPKAPEVATSIAYDTDNLGMVVSAGPQSTHYRYNGFGELVSIQRQNGGTKTFTYDIGGRKTFETVWGTAAGTRFEFDGRGRITKTTDPNALVTQYTYNGPTKTVTVDGKNTTFTTDPMGRLVTVVDALDHPTNYRYDPADRSVKVQQWAGAEGTSIAQVRTWEYNSLGWLTAITQPESGRTEYSNFTVTGKPQATIYGVGSTSPRKVITTIGVLDRVESIGSTYGGLSQTFSYDQGGALALANGKLTSATANGVTRTFKFNGIGGLNGRLTDLVRTVDGHSWTQKIAYNSDGSVAQRTYPDGKIQKLDYFFDKGLPKASGFGSSPTASNLVTMGYDATTWNLMSLGYTVNGASSSFTYRPDQVGLVKMILSAPWIDPATAKAWTKTWNYAYDNAGNLGSDGEDWYTYDKLNRLKSAFVRDPFNTNTGQGLQQLFSYDAFGNRTGLTSWAVTNWAAGVVPPISPLTTTTPKASIYSFNAADAALSGKNQLPATTSAGAYTGAQYDGLGNLTRIYKAIGDSTQSVTLNYDALARVSSMIDAKRATTESYLHDDEGLRIKITDSATGLTKYNLYNESRQLIAQYEKLGTGALTWKKDIVYVGSKEIAEVDATGTNVTFVDHLGSPRYAWRGGTTPIIKQKFLPFGESLADPITAKNFAKGFTNHEATDSSGLIFAQARFYLPWMGRFASPDPARDQHFEQTQSWNIYSYCLNNPTMLIDPTGEAPNKAGVTNPSHVRDFLAGNPSLGALRDAHGGNKDRYFNTVKYGWVDIRHFAEASRRVAEGSQWQLTVKTLGVLNEADQWIKEWGDDYRSGFSPEDIPSNDAGANFGGYIHEGESVADAFDRWILAVGGRNADDQWAGASRLPDSDPSAKGGKGRGSNASSAPVNTGSGAPNESTGKKTKATAPPPPPSSSSKKSSQSSSSSSSSEKKQKRDSNS